MTTLGRLLDGTEGSIKTGPFGTTLKAAEYSPFGVPLISVGEIGEGSIVLHQKTPRVSTDVTERLSQYLLRNNDIVFARKGSIDRSARIKLNEDGYFLGSDGIRVRLPETVSAGFMAYQFLSPRVKSWLRQQAGGTTMPSMNQGILERIQLFVPPLAEQRRIAGVLGALDDLIDTNKRLALDCERLAQSLASNAREQTPLSSFTTWGGLGTIKPAGLVDHYSLPAFDDGRKPERVDGSAIKSNKQKLEHPCVLVARLNPRIPRVWMVYPDQSVTSLASTEFVRITGEGIAEEVIYAVCSAPAFLEQMNGLVTGTTGSHQRVDKDALTSVAVPDVRTLPTANLDAITLLVRQAQVCREELRDLANTRDELLPLLLSGAVTVSESAA